MCAGKKPVVFDSVVLFIRRRKRKDYLERQLKAWKRRTQPTDTTAKLYEIQGSSLAQKPFYGVKRVSFFFV